MSAPSKVYVVMRKSGKLMTPGGTLGGSGTDWGAGPYLHILDAISRESGQSGRDYDVPDRLFLNGQEVVPSGLWKLASAYIADREGAQSAAKRAVENMHAPSFTDEAPGFNPPGFDLWTVSKRTP